MARLMAKAIKRIQLVLVGILYIAIALTLVLGSIEECSYGFIPLSSISSYYHRPTCRQI